MARDEEFGRMVVANRDLAVGDVVMEVPPVGEKISSCHHRNTVSTKTTCQCQTDIYVGVPMSPDVLSLQERPLTWAPMLDSPPVCLTCAQFLQKKSYR